MALSLDCPHCGVRKVETVRTAWFLHGLLLFARYGSKTFVGCDACTRKKVIESLVFSGLFGWWCFPWGLGAPFVIVQNLVQIASGPDERALHSLLARRGVDVDDLLVGENGRTGPQDRLVAGLLAALHRVVWAGGTAEPDRARAAVAVATQVLGDLALPGEIEQALAALEAGSIAAARFSPDAQLQVFATARDVALAGGPVDVATHEALHDVGVALGIAGDLVAQALAALPAETDEVIEEVTEEIEDPTQEIEAPAVEVALRAVAAETLGIDVDAPPAEVLGAYERLACTLPEGDPEAHLARLDFARETLLGPPSAEA